MKIDILVSTMNCHSPEQLLQNMHLYRDHTIIINQVEQLTSHVPIAERFFSFQEKGLSKSRNKALDHSNADVVVISDDDEIFQQDVLEQVEKLHTQYSNYDFIMFHVENVGAHQWDKPTPISYIKSMKLKSVQMSIKMDAIKKKNLRFDESFGIGAPYFWGEENIFLFDALRKKCKMLYVPITIAKCDDSESGWDRANSPENCRKRGVIFYRMTKWFYPLLIIQFAIRKRKLCAPDVTPLENMRYMFQGVKAFKRHQSASH